MLSNLFNKTDTNLFDTKPLLSSVGYFNFESTSGIGWITENLEDGIKALSDSKRYKLYAQGTCGKVIIPNATLYQWSEASGKFRPVGKGTFAIQIIDKIARVDFTLAYTSHPCLVTYINAGTKAKYIQQKLRFKFNVVNQAVKSGNLLGEYTLEEEILERGGKPVVAVKVDFDTCAGAHAFEQFFCVV